MWRKVIAGFSFVTGAAAWGIGTWLIYRSNALSGAGLALAGAVICLGVFAWWQNDSSAGLGAVIETIGQFFSRS